MVIHTCNPSTPEEDRYRRIDKHSTPQFKLHSLGQPRLQNEPLTPPPQKSKKKTKNKMQKKKKKRLTNALGHP